MIQKHIEYHFENEILNSLKMSLNPYRWILGKNQVHFLKKSRSSICICFYAMDFFFEAAPGDGLKNGIYFYQRGIFPLILAYVIWNKHNDIAQLTRYLHMWFSFY